MKHLRIFSVLYLLSLFFISCSSEQSDKTIEQKKLSKELEITKVNLKNDLDSRENPISAILNSYAKSSKKSDVDLQNDLELSYARMKQRIQLVASGKLSSDQYFNDINGAFEENAGFKTGIGKKISEYYKQEHLNKEKKQNIEKSSAFEKFKKIKKLKNDLKQYEN